MTTKQLLFSFNGRISRKLYWRGVLLAQVFLIVPFIFMVMHLVAMLQPLMESGAMLDGSWQNNITEPAYKPVEQIAIFPFIVLSTWSSFALAAKRLHDMNQPIWWLALPIAPLIFGIDPFSVGTIFFTVIGILKGTKGPNKYGPDPLEIIEHPNK